MVAITQKASQQFLEMVFSAIIVLGFNELNGPNANPQFQETRRAPGDNDH
jgi:hypothetical protein